MLVYLQNFLDLSTSELITTITVVLFAGIVRGFAGFGLSALIMAGLAFFIAPYMLIPVCFLLEGVASLLMAKGGFRHANRKVALILAVGSAIGVPIGLYATVSISPELSKTVALVMILLLASLQLSSRVPTVFNQHSGLYLTGLFAGIATGLAGIGGMVVALFVLAQRIPAPEMRASLVMFLCLSMLTSSVWLSLTGLLDTLALSRALFLTPAVIAGVYLGTYLFRPSLEYIYKRFCLYLLIALASVGLLRLLVST